MIALNVSSDIIAHNQGILNCVFTVSGDTYIRHFLPVSWENQNCVYCTLIALHVTRDIIAHYQELLNCVFTASGDTYVSHIPPVSWENHN